MKTSDFTKELETIFQECLDIVRQKNPDYGDDSDSLKNFRVASYLLDLTVPQVIMARIAEKMFRLKNVIKKDHVSLVADEKAEDTIKDIINLTSFILFYLKNESD